MRCRPKANWPRNSASVGTRFREGVKALQVLGVVDSHVGSGMFVRPFSFDPIFENLPYSLIVDLGMVEDMLELQHVLDLGIAADLIEAVTPAQLASLTAILDDRGARRTPTAPNSIRRSISGCTESSTTF